MQSVGTHNIIHRLRKSAIFNDSFWAVFGNGFGTALLLVAGIIIARLLGKDLYGEYGVVKTNMFYLAGFSTFGLGLTSTRFIAKYLKDDKTQISGIINTSTKITFAFSSIIALFLVIFSKELAIYLGQPELYVSFRFLAGIVIIKALCTTSIGILSGLKKFKTIAQNLIISGGIMVISCGLLTYMYGLNGAFVALLISQLLNTGLNYLSINKIKNRLPIYYKDFKARKLISFSFPIALQEISYSVCNWVGIIALTKYSSLGEVGIYSATAQWNAVILFIPGLLNNVVLAHLSQRGEVQENKHKIKILLSVYLCCTALPFIVVYLLSSVIASFYGVQFIGMISVLRVLVFATIPQCCSDVFKSELLAIGKPWILFTIRCIKDLLFLILVVYLLVHYGGENGALLYAIASVIISSLFFLALFITYSIISRKTND